MSGHQHSPESTTSTTATTRRQATDSFGRRFRRAARKPVGTPKARRATLIASGAAVLAIAGSTFAVTTQPAIGEAMGMPSASATSQPALDGTALDRAQAQATIQTASGVVEHANEKVDTAHLEHSIDGLQEYHDISGARLRARIEQTVDASTHVSDQSAAQTKADADAKAKAAAEAAAAAEARAEQRAAAEKKAQELASTNTVDGAKAAASEMASSQYGWGADQFSCLDDLWTKESGWNYRAVNPNGGATGIPQALPGSKMASVGSDWQTNARTQVAWGLQYIKSSYGTPCAAWGHSQATNFY
ncbi:MAG: phospholipase [Williamsia herbipolensis]|nr:phospholipase [Williamsia herbipolensis]